MGKAWGEIMIARILPAVLAALLLEASAADPERSFRVHPVGYADPAAAEEMARAIVKGDGRVVLDEKHNRLLVFATAEEHLELEKMAAQFNVPPKNVRIEVQFAGGGRAVETGAGVGVQGGVVVDGGGVSHGGVVVSPRLEHRETRTTENAVQTLLVASGRSGALRVGESVPYVEWFMQRAVGWGLLQTAIRWQEVGSFLVVEPTVIGEGASATVRIRLTPELSGLVDGHPHRVRFAQAVTEVVAASGQTVRLGGVAQDKEFYSRFLIGMDRAGVRQSTDIWLTPTLVEPLAPPPAAVPPPPPVAAPRPSPGGSAR